MNVGSILNDEPDRPRNSIVSLLNDEKTPTPESPEKSTEKVDEKSDGKSPISNPPTSQNNSEIDELSKLSKLKSKKPIRYTEPPIWAQEWTPRTKREEIPTPNLSEKSLFNNMPSSTDLECCITGLIPPPSVTRRIAEWIYANFIEIPEQNRKFVELELKFGSIMDRKTNKRINILVSTECIYTDVSNIYFELGIHKVGYEDMMKFFEELERQYQENLRSQPVHPPKPRRKFNLLETDVTDSIYYVRNRNEQPKSIRISKDNHLSPPRYTGINKQRISDLYIHNPLSMYDLRLSLSIENPISSEDVEVTMKKSKPNKVRIKQRNTYHHKATITRFDLTKVTEPKELKNTSTGKRIIENDTKYEVELEIDTIEIFNGFDMFKNGTNAIRFEELVEIFVNNARCLNNRVTKLAK